MLFKYRLVSDQHGKCCYFIENNLLKYVLMHFKYPLVSDQHGKCWYFIEYNLLKYVLMLFKYPLVVINMVNVAIL